jgi:hypothetical protein
VLVNEGCPNTANCGGLVRKVDVAGEEDQTSSNIKEEVSNRGYPFLQS